MKHVLHDKTRYLGIDVFRIALAFLIFVFHSKIHIGCSYGILDNFIGMGAIAMTGFFMMSGWLLNKHHNQVDTVEDIWQFYRRRAGSILPLYYFAGGVCSIPWL